MNSESNELPILHWHRDDPGGRVPPESWFQAMQIEQQAQIESGTPERLITVVRFRTRPGGPSEFTGAWSVRGGKRRGTKAYSPRAVQRHVQEHLQQIQADSRAPCPTLPTVAREKAVSERTAAATAGHNRQTFSETSSVPTKQDILNLCATSKLTRPKDVERLVQALITRSEDLPPGQCEVETLLCQAVSAVGTTARKLRDAARADRDQIAKLLATVGHRQDPPSNSFDPVLRSRTVEYAASLTEAYRNLRAVLKCYEATASA